MEPLPPAYFLALDPTALAMGVAGMVITCLSLVGMALTLKIKVRDRPDNL